MQNEWQEVITAEEARNLVRLPPEEQVLAIMPLIKKEATAGRRKLQLYEHFWSACHRHYYHEWEEAKHALENLGYTVEFHQRGGPDPLEYTEISW